MAEPEAYRRRLIELYEAPGEDPYVRLLPDHAPAIRSIRELRRRQGLTQDEAARMCGMTRNYWNRIERGHAPGVSLAKARSVARVLHCHVDDIF